MQYLGIAVIIFFIAVGVAWITESRKTNTIPTPKKEKVDKKKKKWFNFKRRKNPTEA